MLQRHTGVFQRASVRFIFLALVNHLHQRIPAAEKRQALGWSGPAVVPEIWKFALCATNPATGNLHSQPL